MQEFYASIKALHMTLAFVSLSGFMLRGYWSIIGSELLQRRWAKILPHIVDTFLLTTAVLLMVILGQHPGNQTWLAAKFIALIFYIGFGTLAIKRAPTVRLKSIFFVLAIGTFIYIVGVALAHDAASWLH